MKAIQIPKSSNPFIVVINNTVHSYAAGETVEVPDEVAAAIEDALELVPKPCPLGYSKIATVIAAIGSNGYLPYSKIIETDDNGKPFKIRDFYLAITTKLADGSAKKAYVQIIGKNGEDTKCVTGYAPVNFSGEKEKKAWVRFSTFGQDGNGGGVFMVGESAMEEPIGLYGTITNYAGTHLTVSPTEPAVSLKEGIDSISVKLFDVDYKTVELTEGTKIELWGLRV